MYRDIELINPIIIKDDLNNLFKINNFRQIDGEDHLLCYTLEKIAIWDYINPDYNNSQGFSDYFVECSNESIIVSILDETLQYRLKEEGYTVLKSLPKIHRFKKE